MKRIFLITLMILSSFVHAEPLFTGNVVSEYSSIDIQLLLEANNIPGEFTKNIHECIKSQGEYDFPPCAYMHISGTEDIALFDVCMDVGKYKKGFYQVSMSNGEFKYTEWANTGFMEWACNELAGNAGKDFVYHTVRNGYRGYWKILILDYTINQSAGYMIFNIKGDKAILLDSEETDLT